MVKVKICGVTNPSDAAKSIESGADFIGTIVDIPASPRSVSIERSKEIIQGLHPKARGIAVMTPENFKELEKAIDIINPWGVQLHGGEDTGFINRAKEELPCRVIKALHIRGSESIEEALVFSKVCDALLLDTPGKMLGGSGKSHNWSISSKIVNAVKCPVFLAGGLSPENVSAARDAVQPFCLDVSSGVEESPGKKNPDKVRRFIEGAKDSS